ncbi:hypothetical protein L7F22_043409 [Adiantum nelumboides]|nr:hypothetical protein [Adiantum nelumboides]
MVTIELASDEPSTSSDSPQKQHARNLDTDEADIASKDEERRLKHEDDDWETASEGEDVEDRLDDPIFSASGPTPESFEDALTEEEQKQRALSQANAAKAEGNTLYAAGKYEDALARYTNALESLPEHESNNEVRAMCHSNSAACFFQLVLAQKVMKKGKARRRFLIEFKNFLAFDAKWMEEEDLADTPQILKLYLEAFGIA